MGEDPGFLVSFRQRLADLSSSNRMIFLPGLRPGRTMDLTAFSQLDHASAFELLARTLSGRSARLCARTDVRLGINNTAAEGLSKLSRTARIIQEESGAADLHLGWPVVEGLLHDGTPVRCPLLLIPVTLTRDDRYWLLSPRQDSGIEWNRSFIHAVAYHNDVPLAEDLLLQDPGEWGYDAEDRFDGLTFLNTLYKVITESSLQVDFNVENFTARLKPFEDISRNEFIKVHGKGRIRLHPVALLGIFPLSDSFIDPDYRELIRQAREGRSEFRSLEDFFARFQADDKSDYVTPLVSESRLTVALPSDPWQDEVLRAVRSNRSVVVEGPPGTGKSQLIANLVADAVASGKRVLVVSQKRAALEVVHRRLQDVFLTPFMVHVHDIHDDRRMVYDRIAAQIARLDEYRNEILRSDSILAERRFLQIGHRIDRIRETLQTFRSALADTSICGVGIRSLYLSADREAPVVSLKPHLESLQMDQAPAVAARILSLGQHRVALCADDGHAYWENRIPFIGYGQSQLMMLKDRIRTFRDRVRLLAVPIVEATGHSVDFVQFRLLLDGSEDVIRLREQVTTALMPYLNMLAHGLAHGGEPPTDLWLANIQRLAESCFDDEGVETSVSPENLTTLQKALHRARGARRNLLRWIQWNMFAPDTYLVKRTLVANRLTGKEALQRLEKRLDNRMNLEHLLSKFRDADWWHPLPDHYSRESVTEWFGYTRSALAAWNRIRNVRGLETYLAVQDAEHGTFCRILDVLIRGLEDFRLEYASCQQWLTPVQMQSLDEDPLCAPVMVHYLDRHFDRMCAEDELLADLKDHERDILGRIREAVPDASPQQQVDVFMNSLRMAWIEFLEARTPELRMVTSGVMAQLEEEWSRLNVEKIALSGQISRQQVMEKLIDQAAFDGKRHRIAYRELQHQVTKKRRLWPLRKTIAAYTDEVFRLLPCWLASPESVSALFPPERFFDLVLFDEASQCFAERGLPALTRAGQFVIAGDSRQLRPSDLYRIRWVDESEEEPDAEAESLLDLVSMRFRSIRLCGHYRSRSPELMEFSNRHFYDGRLRIIPDAQILGSGRRPITVERVDGIWENQVNRLEAGRVVEHVMEILDRAPSEDIGVITFNHPQQELIMELLEQAFADRHQTWPSTLIVKNIENVQGDERDTIIFSIGYGPSPDGRFRLNFGSLNSAGGGNRLNVAITRARRHIHVVTSISADQIRPRDGMSEGPALLRAWLEYAGQVAAAGHLVPSIRSASMPAPVESISLMRIITANPDDLPSLSGAEILPFRGPFLLVRTSDGNHRAVLTDDKDYLDMEDPAYYHLILPQRLRDLAWASQMLYSRNYWHDRDRVTGFWLNP